MGQQMINVQMKWLNVAFYSEPVNTFIPFYCEQLKNYNNNNKNNNNKFI